MDYRPSSRLIDGSADLPSATCVSLGPQSCRSVWLEGGHDVGLLSARYASQHDMSGGWTVLRTEPAARGIQGRR